ncbi:hypothetical protein BaRGS_00019643, partial [Batillaria attramentaria]
QYKRASNSNSASYSLLAETAVYIQTSAYSRKNVQLLPMNRGHRSPKPEEEGRYN